MGVRVARKKCYEDVRFNVITVMRGCVSNFQKKALPNTCLMPTLGIALLLSVVSLLCLGPLLSTESATTVP